MEGEEQEEGEAGGETEGRRGFHGEPLRGRPRGRGMVHVVKWLKGVRCKGDRQEACSQTKAILSLQVSEISDGGCQEGCQLRPTQGQARSR
jgi:hypothetical protein